MGRDLMVDEATGTLMAQDNGIKYYVISKTRLATTVFHARIILKIKMHCSFGKDSEGSHGNCPCF